MSESASPAPAPVFEAPAAAPSQPPAAPEQPASAKDGDGKGLPLERPGISEKKAAAEQTAEERKKSAAQALKERLAAKREGADKPAEKPEAKPDDKQADKGAQRAKDAPEQPATAKPAPQAEPATKRDDSEVVASRALRDLQAKTREAIEHKRRADTHEGELTQLREKYERMARLAKESPHDFLEEHGLSLEKIVKGTVDGVFKPPSKRYELPPEVASRLEHLDRFAAEVMREREAREKQEQRQKDESIITRFFKQNPDRFPLLATFDWAAPTVIQRAYQHNLTNAEPIMAEQEKILAADFGRLLGNERALNALLKSNPALQKTLEQRFGALSKTASPEASNGSGKRGADSPRSLSDTSTAAPADSREPTREELKKRAASALAERLAGRRAG